MEWRRIEREAEERDEAGRAELAARLRTIEQQWREREERRRREWEALEDRQLTLEEERRLFWDGMFRKMTVMNSEFIDVLRELSNEMRDLRQTLAEEAAEGRAQLRANTEAVLRMLDRLPPPRDATGGG